MTWRAGPESALPIATRHPRVCSACRHWQGVPCPPALVRLGAAELVDKSWGVSPAPGFRVRTNASLDDHAAERAKAREARVKDRAEAMTQRLEARASSRDANNAAREQEMQSASVDPHAAAAKRHRTSGRKDIVPEQRDTRSYTTLVDAGRIRALAQRGASVAGLAGAFAITADAVQVILDAAE